MTRTSRGLGRAVAAAVLLVGVGAATASAERLTLVHMADLDRFDAEDGRGGMGQLAGLVNQVRAEQPNVIVTHAGDIISPSLLAGLDQGEHMIALNNALGVDVATLGNHEFDFGPEIAQERLAEADYPWVSANIQIDGQAFPGTVPTLVIEAGDFKIGFFGLTTPDTAEISSAGERVTFEDPVVAAERAVADLQAQEADVIVALTHMKLSEDQQVADVEGVDLILGGHDHEPMMLLSGDTLIHKAAAQGEYLGVLDLELERTEGDQPEVTITPAWRLMVVEGVTPDPQVQALVEQYQATLDKELGQPIGTTEVALDTRRASVRSQETNFGNLVADVIRAATGADVAITNGGGIRGDKLYEAGTELTRKDILGELPFGNTTVLLELKGSDIEAALENGFSQVEERTGRFPQVSGMTVTYDPTAPAGERVEEVQVGDQPLDPEATYKLATNDFMADGGDGYAMFVPAPRLIDAAAGNLMASQVIEHVESAGSIAPAVEDRIREAAS